MLRLAMFDSAIFPTSNVIRTFLCILLVLTCRIHVIGQDAPTPVPLPNGEMAASVQNTVAKKIEYFDAVESHFDRLINYSLDRYGRTRSGAWVSSIDVASNELATWVNQSDLKGYVAGSHLYWDQPSLLAAKELGKRSGCKCYPDSADNYIRSYLHLGGSFNDLVTNRQRFLNALTDKMQVLESEPRVSMFHTPAWEMIWEKDPATINDLIRNLADQKHATALETTVAANSLLWLMQEADDDDVLTEKLLKLAGDFHVDSENHSDALVFAAALVHASQASSQPRFKEIAMKHASQSLQMLNPPWSTLSLDRLPVRQAEACLTIYTGTTPTDDVKTEIVTFVSNCAKAIKRNLGTEKGESVTAENYGRAIHFLERASKQLQKPDYAKIARELADESINNLFDRDSSMFRSRIGGDRCDAADGPGWLFLALLGLDGNDATNGSALKF